MINIKKTHENCFFNDVLWSHETYSYLMDNFRTKSFSIVWSTENLIKFKATEHYHQEMIWIHHGDTCLFFFFLDEEKEEGQKPY